MKLAFWTLEWEFSHWFLLEKFQKGRQFYSCYSFLLINAHKCSHLKIIHVFCFKNFNQSENWYYFLIGWMQLWNSDCEIQLQYLFSDWLKTFHSKKHCLPFNVSINWQKTVAFAKKKLFRIFIFCFQLSNKNWNKLWISFQNYSL